MVLTLICSLAERAVWHSRWHRHAKFLGRDAAFEPRFFCIAAEGGGLQALVRETLTMDTPGPGGRDDLGTVLPYTLMTPYDAANALTTSARSRGTVTTIDVFGHRHGGRAAGASSRSDPPGTCTTSAVQRGASRQEGTAAWN